MRRSYVVPMRTMVIYEYAGPGGALNLNSTKLPRPWSPWGSSPSRKNPHGRTGNRTRDLMISSQKLWPLDHEAGHYLNYCNQQMQNYIITVYITTVCLCNPYCYMFRHFHVVIRQFTTNALLSYTRSSNCIGSHKHILIATDSNVEKILFYFIVKTTIL
jgi:hypothetical protein